MASGMPRGRMCSTHDVAQHPGYDIFFRRAETREDGKRQRKTKGKEEKQNGGEAELERLRGVRRNSSEEQHYGGQVQLSSLFLLTFETKRKEKRITERERQHIC